MVSKRIARAVVFDMDGTLTKPVLDFAEMRRRANILVGDVLEVLEAMPKRERDRVAAIIEDFEDEALPRMAINDGVHELCTLLDNARMPRALLTRNTAKAVSYFHENHFILPPFSPALARDFRPFKPSPAAILHICREWGISPSETVMVGDSLKDDVSPYLPDSVPLLVHEVVCGNRAGASTIFLDYDGKAEEHKSAMVENEELQPDFIARSMHEVAQILQVHFVLGDSAGREMENLQERGSPEHLQTGV